MKRKQLLNEVTVDNAKLGTYKISKEFPNKNYINRWNLSKEFATAIKKCKTYAEYKLIEKGV
jgi:hypothetical protein